MRVKKCGSGSLLPSASTGFQFALVSNDVAIIPARHGTRRVAHNTRMHARTHARTHAGLTLVHVRT